MDIIEIYKYITTEHQILSAENVSQYADDTAKVKCYLDTFSKKNTHRKLVYSFYIFFAQEILISRISTYLDSYTNAKYLASVDNVVIDQVLKTEKELVDDVLTLGDTKCYNKKSFQRRAKEYAKIIFGWNEEYPYAVKWMKTFPRETAILMYYHALGIIDYKRQTK